MDAREQRASPATRCTGLGTARMDSPLEGAGSEPRFRGPPTRSPTKTDEPIAGTIGLILAHCYRLALRSEEGKGMDDRAFASATELTNEIRNRRIGCVELLDFYLARAERHNPT